MSRRNKKDEDDPEVAAKTRQNSKKATIVFGVICGVSFLILLLNGILSNFVEGFAYGDNRYAVTQSIWTFIFLFAGLFALGLGLSAIDWDARREENEKEKKESQEKAASKARRYKTNSSDVEDEFWGSNRETSDDEMFRFSLWDMLDEDDPSEDD